MLSLLSPNITLCHWLNISCLCCLIYRNFRLADLVTIMNGVCGSLSIFMSATYLATHDEDYLWTALLLPIGGLMFDFMDGKIARWRNESSMLGQELDSLADLVSAYAFSTSLYRLTKGVDLLRCRSRTPGVRCRLTHIPGYDRSNGIHLLWSCSARTVQRNRRIGSQRRQRQSKIFRRTSYPLVIRTRLNTNLLDQDGVDRRQGGHPLGHYHIVGIAWRKG